MADYDKLARGLFDTLTSLYDVDTERDVDKIAQALERAALEGAIEELRLSCEGKNGIHARLTICRKRLEELKEGGG